MPLIQGKSKKSLQKNIKTEMEAHPGKEHRAQDLAIAYSVQRKNMHKKAKGGMISEEIGKGPEQDREPHMGSGYAKGGRVEMEIGKKPEEDMEPHMSPIRESYKSVPESEYDADAFEDGDDVSMHGVRMARGGMAEDMIEDEHHEPMSVTEAIMRRKAARMARGGEVEDGQVDLAEHSEESSNMEDRYSYAANGKEQYDLDQVGEEPMDSNERGDDIDGDEHDMISKLRSKIKAKRGM
jgi:hypothetical protein